MSRVLRGILPASCLIVAAACSYGQVESPTAPATPAATQSSPAPSIQPGTITFDGLTADNAPVSTYEERGFTLAASGGAWQAGLNYGNPRPFIRFTAAGGTTVTGEVRVTGGGQTFSFQSVDLYASTTPIPYVITGTRNGATVFALTDRLPNTFGQFRTVSATNSAAVIDTLTITLANTAAPCCANPMGLDNIVLK